MRTTNIRRHRIARPTLAVTPDEWLTPFDSLLNQVFSTTFPHLSKEFGEDFFVKGSYPKVNVINKEDVIVIEAAVPGLKKDDILIGVADNILTISGKKNQDTDVSENQFIRRELKRSAFKRSFNLNDNLDADTIAATHSDGILSIMIGKKVTVPATSDEQRIVTIN